MQYVKKSFKIYILVLNRKISFIKNTINKKNIKTILLCQYIKIVATKTWAKNLNRHFFIEGWLTGT